MRRPSRDPLAVHSGFFGVVSHVVLQFARRKAHREVKVTGLRGGCVSVYRLLLQADTGISSACNTREARVDRLLSVVRQVIRFDSAWLVAESRWGS